jgi:hypothetical protein
MEKRIEIKKSMGNMRNVVMRGSVAEISMEKLRGIAG